MNLFHSRGLVLHSPLTPRECFERLDAHTELADPARQNDNAENTFAGDVSYDDFNIYVPTAKRKPGEIVPIIYGQFEPGTTGTQITIHFTLSFFQKTIIVLWCLGLLAVTTLIGITAFKDSTMANILSPVVVLGMGGFAMYYNFTSTCEYATDKFNAIFKCNNAI
ncbi:MAG: hypothetical protein EOP54_25485 [Sphingobacteriales bacterium]|nr:MAG: hypothetical protein EOP54_25485 [Sphingobacteriales bacterium]